MSVITKISSYFERSVVTLKLRKEYLNTVTYNTSVLLRIKCRTVWYTERYSMSTYTEVSSFQKTVRFFLAHPVQKTVARRSNPQTTVKRFKYWHMPCNILILIAEFPLFTWVVSTLNILQYVSSDEMPLPAHRSGSCVKVHRQVASILTVIVL